MKIWLENVLTVPTGKANTEKRRSLHLTKVLSNFASDCRSFMAASAKKVIWSNWNSNSNIAYAQHSVVFNFALAPWTAYLCVCTAVSHQIQKGEVLPRSTVDKDSRRQLFSILVRQSLDNKGIPAEHGDVVHRADAWSHFFAEPNNLQLKVQQKKQQPKKQNPGLSHDVRPPLQHEVFQRLTLDGTGLSRHLWELHTKDPLFPMNSRRLHFITHRCGMWRGRNFTHCMKEHSFILPGQSPITSVQVK